MGCKFTFALFVLAFVCNLAPVTHAARIVFKLHNVTSKSAQSLVVGDTDRTNTTGCDLSRYNLGSRFTDIRDAGEGANGCVVLAKDTESGGVEVAIKISKRPGKLTSWTTECKDMKKLRQAACRSHGGSDDTMKLAERYLPTCIEVGGTDDAPFIIMHAAPGKGIGSLFDVLHDKKGAPTFAQLVGAITAMHGIGYTHNDLHNNNVVIMHDEAQYPKLVFIDFGEVVPLAKGGLRGTYKQDETVLANIAGKLANCPEEARYGFPSDYDSSQHESRKGKLLGCLAKIWKIDEEFRAAFGAVIDEAYRREVPSKVPALYHTAWVQKHEHPSQKQLESIFPTPGGWCAEPLEPPEDAVDPKLCATSCTLCPPDDQYYSCLAGPSKGGCAKEAWKLDDHCSSQCACPGPSEQVATPPQSKPDPGLCAKVCGMCPPDDQYYGCLVGPARGGCAKEAWKMNNHCSSQCKCPPA